MLLRPREPPILPLFRPTLSCDWGLPSARLPFPAPLFLLWVPRPCLPVSFAWVLLADVRVLRGTEGHLASCLRLHCPGSGGRDGAGPGPGPGQRHCLRHPAPALLQVGPHRLSIYEEWDPFRFRHMIPTEALQVRAVASAGRTLRRCGPLPSIYAHPTTSAPPCAADCFPSLSPLPLTYPALYQPRASGRASHVESAGPCVSFRGTPVILDPGSMSQ